MTTTLQIPYAIVETCSTLPASDASWTFVAGLIAINDQEGAGQFVGSARFEWRGGLNVVPGSLNTLQTNSLSTFLGKYIRILVYDITTPGAVTVNGVTYSVTWTGIVKRQTTLPDGASSTPGGLQRIEAVGLLSILDNIYIRQGWAYGYQGGVGVGPWDPGYCPLFNARPTKNTNVFGDRYTVAQPNDDGSASAYPFDLSAINVDVWKATDVVNHLLTFYAKPEVPSAFGTLYGPTWALSDPLSCLDYTVDKLDFQGRTVLEALNYLINPRRGATYYPTVSGSTITINVKSTVASAIAVGPVTLPASTTTVVLDSRGNPFITGLEIEQDISSKYEYIQVDGDHPLVACSVNYKQDASGALQKGWDATKEASWDPTINQGAAYENVWRRYVLSDSWSGLNWNQTTIGLRNNRVSSSSGYDGSRTFNTGEPASPARQLKFEKFLPLPADQDYSTTPAANALDMTAPLLAPMLFIKNGSACENITDDYSISIEEDPAAIVIDGDLNDLSARLTDGTSELIVTIGIREANPLMVAHLDAVASWDFDFPKCLVRRIPYCEQWVALEGTVMDVNAGGTAFYTLSSTLTVVDDLPKLQGWLAVLRAWYGNASNTATWHNCVCDFATGNGTFQPGALLTTVHRGDSNLTVNSVITTRARTYTEQGFGTTYTTERIAPDVSCVESHPRVNKVWKSNVERDEGY